MLVTFVGVAYVGFVEDLVLGHSANAFVRCSSSTLSIVISDFGIRLWHLRSGGPNPKFLDEVLRWLS